MGEMTIEQQQALALAAARLRTTEGESKPTAQNLSPTLAEGLKGAIAADPSPLGAKVVSGIGSAVTDAAMRLKQLAGFGGPETDATVRDNRALVDAGGTPAMLGNIAGNMAMTAIPAAGIYGGATNLAARALPAAVAPLVGGAVSGATVAGATQPVLPGESTAQNMAVGAAGGAIGDAVARGGARLLQPLAQSPAVQTLLQNGVVPTPGQSAGANSVWGRIEQKLQSVPIIGDVISGSRNRATNEFNQAALNRAVPIGQPASAAAAPGIGRDAIHRTDQILGQGYDDVLDRIGSVRVSPQFMQSANAAVTDPDLALPQHVQQRLIDIIRTQITQRAPTDVMTAQIAKRVDANLGMLAREYTSSTDGDQRMLARGIRDIQQAWRDNLVASAPPGVAADLQEMNRAFANFVRVERAAGMVGAREGVFSPAQLQSAVRATDTSSRKGQFARGNALMQDLSDAGTSTLSQTVPNSGTADRALMAAMLGGGAAGANEYFGGPGYLSALALSPLIMSRAGSRYAVGDLLPAIQQGGSAAVRGAAPYAANAGTLAAILQQRLQQPGAQPAPPLTAPGSGVLANLQR